MTELDVVLALGLLTGCALVMAAFFARARREVRTARNTAVVLDEQLRGALEEMESVIRRYYLASGEPRPPLTAAQEAIWASRDRTALLVGSVVRGEMDIDELREAYEAQEAAMQSRIMELAS